MNKSVIVSGFGGQGVLFAGTLLSYAAIIENLQTTWIPSYGAEMRGGSANCSVKLSDEEIASPVINQPDILIALSEQSLAKFQHRVKSGGLVITTVDESFEFEKRDDIKYIFVPFAKLKQKFANPIYENVAAIGAFVKQSGVVKVESVQKALKQILKEKREQLLNFNLQSLLAGVNYISENLLCKA